MVRFAWHVEDGRGAHMPPGGLTKLPSSDVYNAACEIELGEEQDPLQAIFTLPANYIKPQKARSIGIVLGHDADASQWDGSFMTEIASQLASHGFIVVRHCCGSSREGKRQRMYEKALDACATSPYAAGVRSWVLAGVGSGARVAAAVALQCRGTIAGCIFVSYPLEEPMPQSKADQDAPTEPAPTPDSAAPLLALAAPTLYIKGDADARCSTPALARLLLSGRTAAADARLLVLPGVDEVLQSPGEASASPATLQQVAAAACQFLEALSLDGGLAACTLPRPQPSQIAPPPSPQQRSGSGPDAAARSPAAAEEAEAAVPERVAAAGRHVLTGSAAGDASPPQSIGPAVFPQPNEAADPHRRHAPSAAGGLGLEQQLLQQLLQQRQQQEQLWRQQQQPAGSSAWQQHQREVGRAGGAQPQTTPDQQPQATFARHDLAPAAVPAHSLLAHPAAGELLRQAAVEAAEAEDGGDQATSELADAPQEQGSDGDQHEGGFQLGRMPPALSAPPSGRVDAHLQPPATSMQGPHGGSGQGL